MACLKRLEPAVVHQVLPDDAGARGAGGGYGPRHGGGAGMRAGRTGVGKARAGCRARQAHAGQGWQQDGRAPDQMIGTIQENLLRCGEALSSMINRLIRRQDRNRRKSAAASSSASPVQEAPDEVPDAIRAYLAQIPAVWGRIDLNNHEPVERIDGWRALQTVVLGDGWSGLEHWGVWSEGDLALLYIKNAFTENVTAPATGSGEIVIDARGALFERLPELAVRCELGTSKSEIVFAWGGVSAAQVRLPIPAELASAPVFRLSIAIDAPRSPYEGTGGASPDRRLVGVGISSIEIRAPGGETEQATETTLPTSSHPA